jgi:hypothetical protein
MFPSRPQLIHSRGRYKVIPNTIAIPQQAGSLNANGAVVASALMYLGGTVVSVLGLFGDP